MCVKLLILLFLSSKVIFWLIMKTKQNAQIGRNVYRGPKID